MIKENDSFGSISILESNDDLLSLRAAAKGKGSGGASKVKPGDQIIRKGSGSSSNNMAMALVETSS